jgi:hypothetical protein
MRAEIRCCCEPGRLLGTVEVDVPYLYAGQVLHFHVPPAISLRPYWEQRDGELFIEHQAERLALPVARVHGEFLDGLAIKSNDTPIETLRRIRGFQEAR